MAPVVLAGCAAPPRPLFAPPAPDHSVTFRLENHLGFGVRVERVSVLLDGIAAFEAYGDTAEGGKSEQVSVEPGAHSLSIAVQASEPCGLSAEPRASVIVRATTTFRTSERPATILADLYAREATLDPIQTLAVRFTGRQALLGVPSDARDEPEGCAPDDALCAIDAKALRARSRNDAVGASCYETRRAEARALRDVVEDSYRAVTREGATAGDAENAQLRARYARARLLSLALEAETCALAASARPAGAIVFREVERACPTPDVTAELGRQ
jgi:hypothetical protein